MALIDKLTNIADAIRGKTGGTDPLTLDGMAEAIESIAVGGGGSSGGGNSVITVEHMTTITVSEPVSAVTIPIDSSKEYDFAIVSFNELGFSQSSWLYIEANTLQPSDPNLGKGTVHGALAGRTVRLSNKTNPFVNYDLGVVLPVEYLAVMPWEATTTIIGGEITVYGGWLNV